MEEMENRLEELKEIKASLKTKSFYELLGVNRTATEEEIKRAYFNLARKYHPDRFNQQVKDTSLINEVFNSLTDAYRILIDPQKRKNMILSWIRAARIRPKIRLKKRTLSSVRVGLCLIRVCMKKLLFPGGGHSP